MFHGSVKGVRVPVFVFSVHTDANTCDWSEKGFMDLRNYPLHGGRNIPVVHLDSTVGVNFLSIFEPGDLRHWNSFSLTHKAGGACTWTGQTLRPLDQGRWCFKKKNINNKV